MPNTIMRVVCMCKRWDRVNNWSLFSFNFDQFRRKCGFNGFICGECWEYNFIRLAVFCDLIKWPIVGILLWIFFSKQNFQSHWIHQIKIWTLISYHMGFYASMESNRSYNFKIENRKNTDVISMYFFFEKNTKNRQQ